MKIIHTRSGFIGSVIVRLFIPDAMLDVDKLNYACSLGSWSRHAIIRSSAAGVELLPSWDRIN